MSLFNIGKPKIDTTIGYDKLFAAFQSLYNRGLQAGLVYPPRKDEETGSMVKDFIVFTGQLGSIIGGSIQAAAYENNVLVGYRLTIIRQHIEHGPNIYSDLFVEQYEPNIANANEMFYELDLDGKQGKLREDMTITFTPLELSKIISIDLVPYLDQIQPLAQPPELYTSILSLVESTRTA